MPAGFSLLQPLATFFSSRIMTYVWLVLILVMGGFFRFTGVDWDEQQHLHPDERFVTMVTAGMSWPESFENYFDPTTSALSPYADNPDVWYVYGTLPLYLTKWIAVTIDMDGYDKVYLVGRVLSGVMDLGCILFLFLVGQRLYGDKTGLLAAALYALAVHPIQLSHFYAVDTFANFFVVMTFYWAIRASEKGNWWFYALMGITLGAGMASKMSVLTLGVVVLLTGVLDFARFYRRTNDVHSALEHSMVRWFTVAGLMLLVFRILQPIAFEGPGFFNFRLSDIWTEDIEMMQSLVEGETDIPPFVQWTDRPDLWFPWKNMVLWGMGLPLGLAAWAGWLLGAYELLRYRKVVHLLPVAYIAIAFFYHGTRWVKYMRYFMPIYPLLAMMAAYLIIWAWHHLRDERSQQLISRRMEMTIRSVSAVLLTLVIVGGTFLYAVAFTSIYTRPVSRIEASRWIYQNIPQGSVLANEHWDDSLPLRIDGKDGFRDWYTGVSMNNYDHYSPEKVDMIVNNLSQTDYVILSSNRLYDSVTRMPLRYPVVTRYYDLLFEGKLGFRKIAEFTSYPQLFGFELPDQSADESFSVYDHPKVTIFAKTAEFDAEEVRRLLTQDIDWYTYLHTTPKRMTRAMDGLMFTEDERQEYQQAGTWSELFAPESWSNRLPLLVWFVALQIIGWLVVPLGFVVFRNLYDRGYILAKAVGLLLTGWGIWLLASWHVLRFSQASIVLVIMLVALLSALVLGTHYRELVLFVKHRWRFLLLEEGLFWLMFGIALFIRWQNPDLWTPFQEDEKMMDFAYLNAVVKTPFFPPYDPWFAGGYLNYPYFGLLLIALLVKLTGIVPAIAYNLALPTFFALTATAAWSVGFNLVHGWRERQHVAASKTSMLTTGGAMLGGVLALLFITILGNLNMLQLLFAREEGIDLNSYLDVSHSIPQEEGGLRLVTEFPFFSFLQAELHPHLLALPYGLLVLALAVNLLRRGRQEQEPAWSLANEAEEAPVSLQTRLQRIGRFIGKESLCLLPFAVVLGSLAPLNPWYTMPFTLLVAVAFLFACYHQHAQAMEKQLQQRREHAEIRQNPPRRLWEPFFFVRWTPREEAEVSAQPGPNTLSRETTPDLISIVWGVLWRMAIVVVLGKLLFLPFHATFASDYDGFGFWKESRIPLQAFLMIQGFFVFVIVSYLVVELRTRVGQNSIVRVIRLVVRQRAQLARLNTLYHHFVQPSIWHELGLYAVLFGMVLVLLLAAFSQWLLALLLLLLLLTLLLMFRPHFEPRQSWTLALIGMGAAMMVFAQLFTFETLEGAMEDFLRIQTVFTVYFQVWIIWGIAAAFATTLLLNRLPGLVGTKSSAESEQSDEDTSDEQFPTFSWVVSRSWLLVFIVLLVASLNYPIFGTLAHVSQVFAEKVEPTLDGTAYMKTASHSQAGREFSLQWDAQAIEWLQMFVPGSPVIVEATNPRYSWAGRVSAHTGLPVLVGWLDFKKQERAVLPLHLVDERWRDLESIYTNAQANAVYDLLQKHEVQYVYVGPLERGLYGGGVEKFAQFAGVYWERVYENPEVQIYRVHDRAEVGVR